MSRSAAEIVCEYGPFPGVDHVHGVTYDGKHVWFASGDKLNAFDPASGKLLRSINVAAHAGTAFDGQHLFQLAEDRIQKVDPKTGRVLATIPAPGGGGNSGLAWAEGTPWVGQYGDRKIYQIDPQTGAILRTIKSDRFVTGHLGRRRALARHPGRRRERFEASRSANGRGPGEPRDAARGGGFGARVRWGQAVLLRRRKEREGEDRPPAQAKLCDGLRLQGPRRLREQVIEAALRAAGGSSSRSPIRRSKAPPLKPPVSNCTFDRGSLSAACIKPFNMLVQGKESGAWPTNRNSDPKHRHRRQIAYFLPGRTPGHAKDSMEHSARR